MNELNQLAEQYRTAASLFEAELQRVYPRGQEVFFKINSRQRVPSVGTVTGGYHATTYGGTVRVHHTKVTARRMRYRDVPVSAIVSGAVE